MTCSVKLVSITPDAEKIMAYCARVSSPNQDNPNIAKLLKYCIDHKHWSVFEMADVCVEIETSRAIAPQLLRHRSFHFQEFSQRYAEVPEDGIILYEARAEDLTNRQNSLDTFSDDFKDDWKRIQLRLWKEIKEAYDWARSNSIAKECARFVLPEQVKTKLYMKGTVRDWIHYVDVRTDVSVQIEHQEIAQKIKATLIKELPIIAEACKWI